MTTPPRRPEVAAAQKWDADLTPLVATPDRPPSAWRRYCDALHTQLLDRWWPNTPVRRALKTDLFDEATGPGLVGYLEQRVPEVVAVDLSSMAVRAAHGRGVRRSVRADVVNLPFANASFDLVVSNSTLDHLDDRQAIEEALRELRRVTAPGGTVIVTLDNPRCPVVAVRSRLPHGLLRRSGLVAYDLGPTLSGPTLADTLTQIGLEVDDTGTMMHTLRVTAIRSAARTTDPAAWVARALRREGRSRWPTAQFSGHFVAVRATRPAPAS